MFLSKQYTRCTACHYSQTGGGLLTPYGRLLADRELSTTHSASAQAGANQDRPTGEAAALWGAFGDALGDLQVGVELRPSHLRFGYPGGHQGQNILMNADVIAAYQKHGWTAYGMVGREPSSGAAVRQAASDGAALVSYEHWLGYQSDGGVGVRVGRFMPAFGIRFADHTAYTRSFMHFDRFEQVYGVEVSDTVGRSQVQVTLAPGTADSIINDDGRRGAIASGRWQFDVAPRVAVVGSAIYRHASALTPQSGAVGGALGFAPTPRMTVWTEVDLYSRDRTVGGRSIVAVNETSFEVVRGLWLKFSPQIRTAGERGFSELRRLQFEADFLPRTHVNVGVSYYHDHDHTLETDTSTVLAQLHLYL